MDGESINITSEKSKPSREKQVALDVQLPKARRLQ